MKTTLEISDAVFRQIKARAALKGQTMRDFVVEAIRDKIASEAKSAKPRGWRAVFGKAAAADVAKVQKTIDAEFSRIRYEDWR